MPVINTRENTYELTDAEWEYAKTHIKFIKEFTEDDDDDEDKELLVLIPDERAMPLVIQYMRISMEHDITVSFSYSSETSKVPPLMWDFCYPPPQPLVDAFDGAFSWISPKSPHYAERKAEIIPIDCLINSVYNYLGYDEMFQFLLWFQFHTFVRKTTTECHELTEVPLPGPPYYGYATEEEYYASMLEDSDAEEEYYARMM